MRVETSSLWLVPTTPEALLALIERPGSFSDVTAFSAAPGLREFFVSDEVSPEWVAALSEAHGADPARRTRAHTLPERNASTRVLEKCGFTLVGEVVDPDDGVVWRWERPGGA